MRCEFFSFLQSTVGNITFFLSPFCFVFFFLKEGEVQGKKSIPSYFLALPLIAIENNAAG